MRQRHRSSSVASPPTLPNPRSFTRFREVPTSEPTIARRERERNPGHRDGRGSRTAPTPAARTTPRRPEACDRSSPRTSRHMTFFPRHPHGLPQLRQHEADTPSTRDSTNSLPTRSPRQTRAEHAPSRLVDTSPLLRRRTCTCRVLPARPPNRDRLGACPHLGCKCVGPNRERELRRSE